MENTFKSYSHNELLPHVGKTLEFKTPTGIKKGVLEIIGTNLWLPYCGHVKATSVMIKINEN